MCFKYLHMRYVKELCVLDRRNGLVERFRGTAEILPKGRGRGMGMVVFWSRGIKEITFQMGMAMNRSRDYGINWTIAFFEDMP